MEILLNPERKLWATILARPIIQTEALTSKVAPILAAVKANGEDALKELTEKLDGVTIHHLQVTQEEIDAAVALVSPTLKAAIEVAAKNIQCFHEAQVVNPEKITTMPGVVCWRKSVGIQKVGLYIPGGSAPLFSTILMLGIPARIAGCSTVVLCSPPDKNGALHPAILYAAQLVGIKKIFKVGGAQAIAAMAYGTVTIPKVFKIFGPGNQYVTCAKQLVQQDGIAIDMPAGPSEVCILADDTANASFVAADLLSQAEHGQDSQVLLITTSATLIKEVENEINQQVELLQRKKIALKALANSKAILLESISEAIEMVNEYAPEHLILACENYEAVAEEIVNAGSIFLGNYSPESVGDYASGTNHTLPTNGYAIAYSGVSVDSFVKKITFQELTKEGLNNIAETVQVMAASEGLDAHKNAVTIRL